MSQLSRFSKIYVKIWYSNDFRSLSEDGKLIFLYLLTSPHRNMGGYYPIPIAYLCYDLNLDEDKVRNALDEVNDRQMVIYDYDTQMVLILKWFLYNPIENENQAKGLNKQLAELPHSKLLETFIECVDRYCNKYKEVILRGLVKPFSNPFQTLSEPYAKPGAGAGAGTGVEDIHTCAPDGAREHIDQSDDSVEASNGVTATSESGNDGVEAEEVTATQEDKPSKSGPRSPFKSKRQEQLFDEFWELYPKKRSKGQAEKTWVKLKPDEQLFAAIVSGLERAKTSAEWQRNGGQYIPHPSTWLNAKGWEDEYDLGGGKDGGTCGNAGCSAKDVRQHTGEKPNSGFKKFKL